MKPYYTLLLIALVLGACAQSSTVPLAVDTMQITTRAAPACGGSTGAQKLAMKRAAVETITRGYDKFVILGAQDRNDAKVLGYTPVHTGGQPIIAGGHKQSLIVKMFKADDPAGANALPARVQLGPEWQKIVNEGESNTCL